MRCNLCNGDDFNIIYTIRDISIFQNKTYDTQALALAAPVGNLSLVGCRDCGFIFNSEFYNDVMDYDVQYQNEQGCSDYFNNHINYIIDMLIKRGFRKKKIIEIGCGKGYFLEELQKRGFDVVGFDPAYEGNNPSIIRDYFTNKYKQLDADLIILRHVIEHVPQPLDLLRGISSANNHKGSIFIETPDFNWIANNRAFFDIFYEHCNYFTPRSLSNVFNKSEIKTLFNRQYMYVLAELKALLPRAKRDIDTIYTGILFENYLRIYRNFVKNHKGLLVYGAGAKGVTFANLTDPEGEYISYLIDVNPKKQNRYIAKTAHKIISPDLLTNMQGYDIIVMNDNYLEEIRKSLFGMDFNIFTIGEINESYR